MKFGEAINQGGGREDGVGFGREVELGVIREAVKRNIKFTENKAKGKEVCNEKEGTQDRALGDTRGDRGGMGTEGFELDELSAVREIGMEPDKGDASDADG